MRKQIEFARRETDTVQGFEIVIFTFFDDNGQPLTDATYVILAEEEDLRLPGHLDRLSLVYQAGWDDLFAESRGGLS